MSNIFSEKFREAEMRLKNVFSPTPVTPNTLSMLSSSPTGDPASQSCKSRSTATPSPRLVCSSTRPQPAQYSHTDKSSSGLTTTTTAITNCNNCTADEAAKKETSMKTAIPLPDTLREMIESYEACRKRCSYLRRCLESFHAEAKLLVDDSASQNTQQTNRVWASMQHLLDILREGVQDSSGTALDGTVTSVDEADATQLLSKECITQEDSTNVSRTPHVPPTHTDPTDGLCVGAVVSGRVIATSTPHVVSGVVVHATALSRPKCNTNSHTSAASSHTCTANSIRPDTVKAFAKTVAHAHITDTDATASVRNAMPDTDTDTMTKAISSCADAAATAVCGSLSRTGRDNRAAPAAAAAPATVLTTSQPATAAPAAAVVPAVSSSVKDDPPTAPHVGESSIDRLLRIAHTPHGAAALRVRILSLEAAECALEACQAELRHSQAAEFALRSIVTPMQCELQTLRQVCGAAADEPSTSSIHCGAVATREPGPDTSVDHHEVHTDDRNVQKDIHAALPDHAEAATVVALEEASRPCREDTPHSHESLSPSSDAHPLTWHEGAGDARACAKDGNEGSVRDALSLHLAVDGEADEQKGTANSSTTAPSTHGEDDTERSTGADECSNKEKEDETNELQQQCKDTNTLRALDHVKDPASQVPSAESTPALSSAHREMSLLALPCSSAHETRAISALCARLGNECAGLRSTVDCMQRSRDECVYALHVLQPKLDRLRRRNDLLEETNTHLEGQLQRLLTAVAHEATAAGSGNGLTTTTTTTPYRADRMVGSVGGAAHDNRAASVSDASAPMPKASSPTFSTGPALGATTGLPSSISHNNQSNNGAVPVMRGTIRGVVGSSLQPASTVTSSSNSSSSNTYTNNNNINSSGTISSACVAVEGHVAPNSHLLVQPGASHSSNVSSSSVVYATTVTPNEAVVRDLRTQISRLHDEAHRRALRATQLEQSITQLTRQNDTLQHRVLLFQRQLNERELAAEREADYYEEETRRRAAEQECAHLRLNLQRAADEHRAELKRGVQRVQRRHDTRERVWGCATRRLLDAVFALQVELIYRTTPPVAAKDAVVVLSNSAASSSVGPLAWRDGRDAGGIASSKRRSSKDGPASCLNDVAEDLPKETATRSEAEEAAGTIRPTAAKFAASSMTRAHPLMCIQVADASTNTEKACGTNRAKEASAQQPTRQSSDTRWERQKEGGDATVGLCAAAAAAAFQSDRTDAEAEEQQQGLQRALRQQQQLNRELRLALARAQQQQQQQQQQQHDASSDVVNHTSTAASCAAGLPRGIWQPQPQPYPHQQHDSAFSSRSSSVRETALGMSCTRSHDAHSSKEMKEETEMGVRGSSTHHAAEQSFGLADLPLTPPWKGRVGVSSKSIPDNVTAAYTAKEEEETNLKKSSVPSCHTERRLCKGESTHAVLPIGEKHTDDDDEADEGEEMQAASDTDTAAVVGRLRCRLGRLRAEKQRTATDVAEWQNRCAMLQEEVQRNAHTMRQLIMLGSMTPVSLRRGRSEGELRSLQHLLQTILQEKIELQARLSRLEQSQAK